MYVHVLFSKSFTLRSVQSDGVLLCRFCFQKNTHVVTIDGYEDVPANNEGALKKAVASQPVSIAIEAGGRDFQLYSGVCKNRACLDWNLRISVCCFELRI